MYLLGIIVAISTGIQGSNRWSGGIVERSKGRVAEGMEGIAHFPPSSRRPVVAMRGPNCEPEAGAKTDTAGIVLRMSDVAQQVSPIGEWHSDKA